MVNGTERRQDLEVIGVLGRGRQHPEMRRSAASRLGGKVFVDHLLADEPGKRVGWQPVGMVRGGHRPDGPGLLSVGMVGGGGRTMAADDVRAASVGAPDAGVAPAEFLGWRQSWMPLTP